MAVSKPILNFPLPQELKDQIWSKFLVGQVVRQTCRYECQPAGQFYTKDMRNLDWPRPEQGRLQLIKCTKSAYDFQMSVLGINKAIRADTLKLLAQRNTFVLVRYNCPALRAYLDQLHVPIVAGSGLQHSSYHSFEIDIDWPCPSLQEQSFNEAPNPPRALLMLEQDMPNFWLVLRLLCQKAKPSVIVFEATPGRPSSIYDLHHDDLDPYVGIPTVTVSGRSVQYCKLTPEDCCCFLAPIEYVVGLGYNIRFHGLEVEPARLLQLQKVIAPSIICSTARQSFHLDTLVQLKEQADILAVAGDHEAAEAMFGCIESAIYSEMRDAESEYKQMLDRLRATILVSMAWLCCRRGAMDLALTLSSTASSATPQNSSGPAFDNHMHTNYIIYVLVWLQLDPTRVLPWYPMTASMIMDELQWLTENERVLHDILWLEQMLSQPQLSRESIRMEDTSLGKFPFPVFDAGPISSLKNIVGWQDTEQLGALSSRQKEAVHALQKQHRLPLSEF